MGINFPSSPRRRGSSDPRLRVKASYARYCSRWIPAFAGMTVLFALFWNLSVQAADQCYTPEQLHAEQLLRLHSELMVTTVTCRQSSIGEDLVPKYTGFTKAHIHDLHEAEQTLESYYKHNSGGDGVARLDKLRTQLANEYGQRVANVSAQNYCMQHRDVVVQMYEARPEQVDLEVERMVAEEKSYGHLCGANTRIAKHGQ